MKNYVYIATSLDGYIAGKNDSLDWLPSPDSDLNLELGFEAFMNKVDALVMGKNTFEMVRSFGISWPYTKPVFVVSNSMSKTPEGYEDKIKLLRGSSKEILEEVHSFGYRNLYIDGGVTVQNFLKEDLIDELIITTIPVLLGEGKSLFSSLENKLDFECVNASVDKGIVQTHYKRKK